MTAFFSGVVFGALLVGFVAVFVFTRGKRKPREIDLWTEEAYQAPPVKTRILVNKREITL